MAAISRKNDLLSRLEADEPNPALLEHARKRAESVQNRIADRITDFAGSMAFVYIHILWFGSWIGFGVEKYPYGLLTMIVSLEAIFLSTFVMISQNRADAKRQVLADQQWQTVQEEDRQNVHLLKLSEQILDLTKAVHEASRFEGLSSACQEIIASSSPPSIGATAKPRFRLTGPRAPGTRQSTDRQEWVPANRTALCVRAANALRRCG
jgi:uncharacterized membrane protein